MSKVSKTTSSNIPYFTCMEYFKSLLANVFQFCKWILKIAGIYY